MRFCHVAPRYGEKRDAAARQLLTKLSLRQIVVTAAYLDGLTQEEIAAREGIDQATVCRDLAFVKAAVEKIGQTWPEPPRLHAVREIQLSDGLYKAL